MKTTIALMLASLVTLGAAVANADAPKAPKAPDKIHVATCNDGKEYWAPTNEHRGACSGHGGVAAWTDGSPVKSHGRKTEYRFTALQ